MAHLPRTISPGPGARSLMCYLRHVSAFSRKRACEILHGPASAETSETCLPCHGDPDLRPVRGMILNSARCVAYIVTYQPARWIRSMALWKAAIWSRAAKGGGDDRSVTR
jgi:hypothetical protein